MGFIVDAISEARVKGHVRELKSCKRDLEDDCGSILAINKNVQSLISDVNSFLGSSGAARVVYKLEELSEPYQGSDYDLNNAKSCIDNEIYYLEKGLKSYEESCKDKEGGGGFR